MTQTATSPQRKPLLDEASFQQLLSAAYVLQEHNDRLRAKGVHSDFAENLSAIVETQKLIQTLQLDLAAAAELVADRVQKITNASGAAIGILEKGELFYRAATGSAVIDAGTHVPLDATLSADCVTRGSALNYPDVTPSLHVKAELFRARDVKAFIAVPVYHAGQVAGVLELRFARSNSFRESDLRAAELMAGLLSEAMVTAARMKWKEALASERQSMLEALERIKPQIERLGSDPLSIEGLAAAQSSTPAMDRSLMDRSLIDRPSEKQEPLAMPNTASCSACGSNFFDESESFCGICGSPRPPAQPDVPNIEVPNEIHAPWLTPYGQENPTNGNSAGNSLQEPDLAREGFATVSAPAPGFPPAAVPAPVQRPAESIAAQTAQESESVLTIASVSSRENLSPVQFTPAVETPGSDSLRIVPVNPAADDLVMPASSIETSPWGSARKTQQWLETVKSHHGPRAEWLAQQWQRRRANIYVVAAATILLLVISGWGIRPAGTNTAGNAAPAAKGQQQAPPPPQLTLFEKLLVSLGLAEAPPPPVYMGNPETQVWIDVHTALYYCPGSDLYGKTADGKFTSQRDAQQDQFEPANRKACP